MSKRNFILLIAILAFVVIAVFGFLYFRSGKTPGEVVGEGTNFLAQFNPFSSQNKSPNDEAPGIDINGEQPTDEELAVVKLKKVSSMPVAGFTVFNKERLKEVPVAPPAPPLETTVTVEEETTTPIVIKKINTKPVPPATEFVPALRYVSRADGNIYQTFVDKLEERRFSETVIPKVYDAYFGNKGQSVVMRNLKSDRIIQTFSGNLPKEKLGEDVARNDIQGVFLTEGIKDISLSPDTSKIFYLLNTGESTVGTILNLLNNTKTQVFSSDFTEWNSFWPTSKIITLTTKPSGIFPGQMYMIDVDKKNFSRILGDINGLTTQMSPSGKLVLVGNSALSLFIYHTDTKAYDAVEVKTLPEKCVWNKTSAFIYCAVPSFLENGALYPDDWYRGETSFSDQIWRINAQNGLATLLADPVLVPGGEDIDGIKLSLDEAEDYLFFVNKKDSFLWELELK